MTYANLTDRHFETSIVIGHGSIGKKHAEKLSHLSHNLLIVDPIIHKYEYEIPTSHVNDIGQVNNSNSKADLVVISNWGPDHFETIKTIISKGYKQIIIEKPMVTSLHELKTLERLIEDNNIKVVVNQGWHHEKLADRILEIAQNFSLGNAFAIWVNGGARCLSTAGSHYIHLANMIFLESPTEMNANLNFDYINPRSSNLVYVDGVTFIKFSRKMLSISYTNFSSIEGDVQIIWKEAVGFLEGTHLRLKGLALDRPYPNIITRYAKPSEEIFNGVLPQTKTSINLGSESIYFDIHFLSKEKLLKEFGKHVISNRILLYCLIANELKRTLSFDERIENYLYVKKFYCS